MHVVGGNMNVILVFLCSKAYHIDLLNGWFRNEQIFRRNFEIYIRKYVSGGG